MIGLASFISLIIILIGLGMIINGRNEFGNDHREFVAYAAIAIVLGFGIFVLGTLMMATAAIPGATTDSNDQELPMELSRLAREITIGMMVVQLGSLMILIGEVLLVYKLEDEVGRVILYGVLILGVIIAIISTIMFSLAINEFLDAIWNAPSLTIEEEFAEFQNRINSISQYSLITTILLLIAYYIPYERIDKGELVPVLPNTKTFDPLTYSPQHDPLLYPDQTTSPQQAPVVLNLKIVPSPPPPPPPPPPEEEKTQDYETTTCPRCGIKCLKGYGPCPFCGYEGL